MEHHGDNSLDPTGTHPEDPQGRRAIEYPRRRQRRARWIAFALIVSAIAISDQFLKNWVVANFRLNEPSPIVGDWLRVDFIHNAGGLFGLLQGSAQILALVTVAVAALLVALEVEWGWRSWLVTLALALLLGGAVGNFVDRIRFGYVVDFADIGVGTLRFYVFNVADAAVTIAILLLIATWFVAPGLERRKGAPPEEGEPLDGAGSSATGNGPALG